MVSRSDFVLLLLCLVVAIAFSNGQQQRTQSSNTTPGDEAGRSLVINNNCSPTDVDREMIAHIKAKVDYIAGQLSQGKSRHIYSIAWIFANSNQKYFWLGSNVVLSVGRTPDCSGAPKRNVEA